MEAVAPGLFYFAGSNQVDVLALFLIDARFGRPDLFLNLPPVLGDESENEIGIHLLTAIQAHDDVAVVIQLRVFVLALSPVEVGAGLMGETVFTKLDNVANRSRLPFLLLLAAFPRLC